MCRASQVHGLHRGHPGVPPALRRDRAAAGYIRVRPTLMVMRPQDRARQIARRSAVSSRSVGTLSQANNWTGRTARGLRQLGEVALDELVVTGMTLTAPPPACTPRSDLSPGGRRADPTGHGRAATPKPEPLQIRTFAGECWGRIRLRRVSYERPATAGLFRRTGRTHRRSATSCDPTLGVPAPGSSGCTAPGRADLSDLAVARVERIRRELGFNVALPVQPGHGVRRRSWPLPDTDPLANVAGMMRAVSEVFAGDPLDRPAGHGGGVVGIVVGRRRVWPRWPRRSNRWTAWRSTPRSWAWNAMIASHLHRWGDEAADVLLSVLGSDTVTELTSVIDPLAVQPLAPGEPPADRGRVERPDGHARAPAGCCCTRSGAAVVLARRQPCRACLLGPGAGRDGAIPA